MRGDYQTAISDGTRALECDASCTAEALWARARACVQLQRYQEAVADLSKLIAIQPRHLPPVMLRGHCYVLLNDYDGASFDFNTIIESRGTRASAQVSEL